MGSLDAPVGVLGLLAAAALMAQPPLRAREALALTAGFCVAGAAGAAVSLPAAVTAGCIACCAAWASLRPPPPWLLAAAAGACAALGARMFVDLGAPAAVTHTLVLVMLAAVFVLGRRGTLANSRLRDEALLGLTWVAAIACAAPALAAGWDSARVLNGDRTLAGGDLPTAGTWAFVALTLTLGMLRALWSRR